MTRAGHVEETWNYSGAPAMLAPKRALLSWAGIWVPLSGDSDRREDFITPDGRRWIDSDVDLDHPRSDYDRLCVSLRGEPCLVRVGSEYALVIDDGGADSFRWWHELPGVVANCGGESLDRCLLDHLTFRRLFTWSLSADEIVLMNSASHGHLVLSGEEEDCTLIQITPGAYLVEAAESNGMHLYRLQRVTA